MPFSRSVPTAVGRRPGRPPVAALVAGLLALLLLPTLPVLLAERAAAVAATVYEAEDGTLSGTTVGSAAAGYSGTGYVEGFDAAEDSVTITVPDSPGGLYDLSVRYSAPFGQKVASLRLNGAGAGQVTLTERTDFAEAAAGKVLLEAGENTISVVNNWGWYYIDAIILTPTAPRPPHQVTDAPVNPDASAETRSLMRYLVDHYGETILSGQQDMASIAWVEENIGATPAVGGFDLMDYSPSRVERGTTSREVENMLEWDQRGGMVTLAWHWNAPSGLIDEPGREWWRGFYTDATTFDLAAALADPASTDYQLLLRDMDAIAVQLQRLEDARVPVLWRPLHEAEGGWFWWGAKGPEPAKELWNLLYQRLTEHHGLDNLIWVWNSASPDWYPGDATVDIVSIDSYPPAGDHGPVSASYDALVELGGDRKLVALGEVGSIPDPALLQAYQADWMWFVTWSGDFISGGQHNSREFLQRLYADPYVTTLDELGDFKHYDGDGGSGGPTDPPPTGCTATYRVLGQWSGGFQGEVTVTNPGERPISGWTVRWTLPGGQTINQSWSTLLTVSGSTVTAANAAWNGSLGAGATATFGFIAGGAPAGAAPQLTCTTTA
ncbi:glycosyl hydrolase [Allostreptomyces psammosilenae]|uniref:Mannan endo-1,4-beta-mannosidase n=1 Tax=Allostreptomyces psammosilenae TaxID=1892865 RepID=A0A853A123_9ACTN|nr:glycosyl hydrolase [Allostreptomyces psammosilenae]NYI08256.1 hypothetical protein [Allostreptomyces psammosilenae]